MKLQYFQKYILIIVYSTICNNLFAQYNLDTLKEYESRFYDPRFCVCPAYQTKPGEKVSEAHPNAKFLNDTSLWEWKKVTLGYYGETEVYDLKPQYKDTIITNSGSVVEVPVWLKYPEWKKEEAIP